MPRGRASSLTCLAGLLLSTAARSIRPVVWRLNGGLEWTPVRGGAASEGPVSGAAAVDTITAITHSSAAAALVVEEDLRDVIGPSPVADLLQRVARRPTFSRLAPSFDVPGAEGATCRCFAGDGAYWDHCGITGATRHACGVETSRPFSIVIFAAGEPYRWRRYIGEDSAAADVIDCPRLFAAVGPIREERECGCFAIRLDVVTIPNQHAIPVGRRLHMVILGNRELDHIGVMPVRRHVEDRRFATRIRTTLEHFRRQRSTIATPVVCGCAGGGIRSMISGLCGLHVFDGADVLAVSATSGGGWALSLHYLTDRLSDDGADRARAIAELCRELKNNLDGRSRASFFPLQEIVRDVEDCHFDWARVIRRMFRTVTFRPPSAEDPPLFLHSCTIGDCVETSAKILPSGR